MAIVVFAAALPSVVHAVAGGALLVDDFGFLVRSDEVWLRSVDRFSRPFQLAIHYVQFTVLGARPWAHALVMAVASALVGVALARAVAVNLGARWAAPVAVLWAWYPAATTIRYWGSTVPSLLALGCLAVAWRRVAVEAGPSPRTTAVLCVSILSYESGMFLAIVLLGLSCRPVGWVRRLPHLGVFGVVVAINRVTSPKGDVEVELFDKVGDLVLVLIGPSMTPSALGPAWLLVTVLPLVTGVFRVTRGPTPADRVIAVGGVAVVLGMAVMATISFPLVPVGLMDRANLMAGPGMAMVLVGSCAALGHHLGPTLARTIGAAVAAAFLASMLETGVNVRRTTVDLELALAASVGLEGTVELDLPTRSGYAAVTRSWSSQPAAVVLGHAVAATFVDDRSPAPPDWIVRVDADGTVRIDPGGGTTGP